MESDDGYLCAKNCHGTVALNPLVGWLVGWFVKGASPHRKVHSMLGFSNVGMLALLKDTAVNQTWLRAKEQLYIRAAGRWTFCVPFQVLEFSC